MQLMEADMDHSRTKSAPSVYPALVEEFCKGEPLKLNQAHNHYSAVSTHVSVSNLNKLELHPLDLDPASVLIELPLQGEVCTTKNFPWVYLQNNYITSRKKNKNNNHSSRTRYRQNSNTTRQSKNKYVLGNVDHSGGKPLLRSKGSYMHTCI